MPQQLAGKIQACFNDFCELVDNAETLAQLKISTTLDPSSIYVSFSEYTYPQLPYVKLEQKADDKLLITFCSEFRADFVLAPPDFIPEIEEKGLLYAELSSEEQERARHVLDVIKKEHAYRETSVKRAKRRVAQFMQVREDVLLSRTLELPAFSGYRR
jgi:hypothetical protein